LVLDVYHAIACYLIGGHGKSKAPTHTRLYLPQMESTGSFRATSI
jgi:hypothetical protein